MKEAAEREGGKESGEDTAGECKKNKVSRGASCWWVPMWVRSPERSQLEST